MPNAGIVAAAAAAITLLAAVRETAPAPSTDRQRDIETGGDGGLKSLNIELIKSSILNKLGMQRPLEFGDRLPPNDVQACKHSDDRRGSSTVAPSRARHCVDAIGYGRTDTVSRKTAAASPDGYNADGGGDDDDYHVKMQKLIVFAQSHPTTQNPRDQRPSLYFTFSDQTQHYRITKAILWLYKKRSDAVVDNPAVNIDVYRINPADPHPSSVSNTTLVINTTEPGWVSIELQRNMSDWFNTMDEVKNLTLMVQASYPNKNTTYDKMPYITDARKREDITEIPYLEVHTHHMGIGTGGKQSSSSERVADTTAATR